jgi:hypothetical protein
VIAKSLDWVIYILDIKENLEKDSVDGRGGTYIYLRERFYVLLSLPYSV